jgi:hypothetical protein
MGVLTNNKSDTGAAVVTQLNFFLFREIGKKENVISNNVVISLKIWVC